MSENTELRALHKSFLDVAYRWTRWAVIWFFFPQALATVGVTLYFAALGLPQTGPVLGVFLVGIMWWLAYDGAERAWRKTYDRAGFQHPQETVTQPTAHTTDASRPDSE